MKTILKKFATFLCAALVLCACSDDDYSEAHQSLMALIRQAESLVEESTEGIEEGDTAPGSKKALQARIDQASRIRFREQAFSALTHDEREQLAEMLEKIRVTWEELDD